MGRGAVVTLRVAADAVRIRRVLDGVPGISRVAPGPEREGVSAFTLALRDPGVCPQVAAALVGAGLPLVELRHERESLEDVFVRLTQHSGAAPAGPGAGHARGDVA
jgi:hypothetical protein